jgi:hypothetical protein
MLMVLGWTNRKWKISLKLSPYRKKPGYRYLPVSSIRVPKNVPKTKVERVKLLKLGKRF